MPIIAQLQVPRFPVRAYLHDGGIEAYGQEPIAAAEEFLIETMQRLDGSPALEGFPYSVCILWADGRDRIVDIVRYKHDMETWPGNPEMDPGVSREDWWSTAAGPKTCGDGIILLGEEEKMRRTTGSLDEYLAAPHVLDKL